MQGRNVDPPSCPWVAGRLIRASAWSGVSLSGPEVVLRTLSAPGDLAPDEAGPGWSLHLGLPDHLGSPECILLANGFVIDFPRQPALHRVRGLLVQRGLMVVEAGFPLPAALWSTVRPVITTVRGCHVSGPDHAVVLARPSEHPHRFVLAVSRDGLDAALRLAVQAEGTDVDALLARECELRAPFYEQLAGLDADLGMISHAVETLVFHLEAGRDGPGERWSAADPRNHRCVRAEQVLPLTLAWLRIDATVALEGVRGALLQAGDRGAAPACWDPLGAAAPDGVAWPCLVQSLRAVFEANRSDEAVLELLPLGASHLESVIDHLDPGRAGLPRWPTRGESFLPACWTDGAASCAAAAMLLREIDDLAWLERRCGEAGTYYNLGLAEYRDRLARRLEETFWDGALQAYRDLDGVGPRRIDLGGLLPIWLDSIYPERAERIAVAALDPSRLGLEDGVAAWQTLQADGETALAPAALQVYAIHALRRAGAEAAARDLEDRLCQSMVSQWRESGVFPPEPRVGGERGLAEPDADEGTRWEHSPTMPAALAVLVCPEVLRRTAARGPAWLGRLDRHRRRVAAAAVGGLVLLVLAASFAVNRPGRRGGASDPSLAVSPMVLPGEERLEQAVEAIQRRIEANQLSPEEGRFMEACLRFRRQDYVAAERQFRELVEDPVHGPKALMNLALSLYRQSRPQEAVRHYAAFLERHPELNPEWSYMARTAIAYLKESGTPADAPPDSTPGSPPGGK